MNLDKFKVKKTVKLYNGREQISSDDFLDGETVQINLINSDGIKENVDCRFGQDLMEELQKALDAEEIKAVTIFKK